MSQSPLCGEMGQVEARYGFGKPVHVAIALNEEVGEASGGFDIGLMHGTNVLLELIPNSGLAAAADFDVPGDSPGQAEATVKRHENLGMGQAPDLAPPQRVKPFDD